MKTETRTAGARATAAKGFKPFVADQASVAEFTPKAIALGAFFAVLFGAATVYLALRAGVTVSASIPIAVLSIAVFKKIGSTILENNIVQTIGSAGESVAAGIVFTVTGFLFLSPGAGGENFFQYWPILMLPRGADDDPPASRAHRRGARQPGVPGGDRLCRSARCR